MPNPLVTFLKLFKDISPDEEAVEEALTYRTYKEGELLLKDGGIAKELFFICKGILKIVDTNDKGNPVTHFFIKENQFCTILKSFNNGKPCSGNIIAACDTEVIVITKTKLLALYKKVPYMKELIDSIIQQRLIDKIEASNGFLGIDAAARYKLFLMREPDIALRVSLTDIASYLGITPQSLSRIRKNLC